MAKNEFYTKVERALSLLQEIQEDAEFEFASPEIKKSLTDTMKETLIYLIVHKDFTKSITSFLSNTDFVKVHTGYKTFEQFHRMKFKKAAKSLKHIFQKNNTVVPTDWEKVFYDWYILKYPEYQSTPLQLVPPIEDSQILEWAKEYSEKFKIIEEAPSETIKNLPHKLTLLHDLGILDLIEERFKDKTYHGKARVTDTAKLISSLLEIDNYHNVRQALKNKDYLSDKAKKNAIQTLKSHGLEPVKFTD